MSVGIFKKQSTWSMKSLKISNNSMIDERTDTGSCRDARTDLKVCSFFTALRD